MLKVSDPNPIHINVDKAVEYLRKFDALLTELDFQYCLCGGTLLGCMRHNAIMSWDDDIDILINEEHMLILEHELREIGHDVYRNVHVSTYTDDFKFTLHFEIDGLLIDFWPARYVGSSILTCSGSFMPRDVFPLRRVKFYDFSICIPQNPFLFLDRTYPDTWRTKVTKRLDGHNGKRLLVEDFVRPLPEQIEV